jgi:D-sedoheptulose 7-phosphate isomerase
MDPTQRVIQIFNESLALQRECVESLSPIVVKAAHLLAACVFADRKVLSCGNGGSAASANYFVSQMLSRFEIERPGLPAIALTGDGITLTAIGCDYQFADMFARQIRALGQSGDVLVAISTSGAATNIVSAIDAAHDREMRVVLLTGCDGGHAALNLGHDDIEIRVPSFARRRIHEVHLILIHCLCELVDRQLLGEDS